MLRKMRRHRRLARDERLQAHRALKRPRGRTAGLPIVVIFGIDADVRHVGIGLDGSGLVLSRRLGRRRLPLARGRTIRAPLRLPLTREKRTNGSFDHP